MGDLISREALRHQIKQLKREAAQFQARGYTTGYISALSCVEGMMAHLETVDAEPVRHGKWIESYAYGAWHYDCPFCDDGYATKEREGKPVKYCSNCGAKMDAKDIDVRAEKEEKKSGDDQ